MFLNLRLFRGKSKDIRGIKIAYFADGFNSPFPDPHDPLPLILSDWGGENLHP